MRIQIFVWKCFRTLLSMNTSIAPYPIYIYIYIDWWNDKLFYGTSNELYIYKPQNHQSTMLIGHCLWHRPRNNGLKSNHITIFQCQQCFFKKLFVTEIYTCTFIYTEHDWTSVEIYEFRVSSECCTSPFFWGQLGTISLMI